VIRTLFNIFFDSAPPFLAALPLGVLEADRERRHAQARQRPRIAPVEPPQDLVWPDLPQATAESRR